MKKNHSEHKTFIKILSIILVLIISSLFIYALQIRSETTIQETTIVNENEETENNNIESKEIVLHNIPALEIPLCPAVPKNNETGEELEKTISEVKDHEIHQYNGFELCYRESYEEAEWVAYCLTKEELNSVTKRSNNFRADNKITTGSATPNDYTKSGYDRGHLAPAADMSWSIESMSDSFYMSNMTPQTPQFNRGIWKTLEEQVRYWADFFGEVYVITGPILEKKDTEYKSIGKNEVAVPEYFYKVLASQTPKSENSDSSEKIIMIGFIIPNSECEGTLKDYVVSIDEIEKRTQLDFFSPIPDSIEDEVENLIDTSSWFNN